MVAPITIYSNHQYWRDKLLKITTQAELLATATGSLAKLSRQFQGPLTQIVLIEADRKPAAVINLLKQQLRRTHEHGIILVSGHNNLTNRLDAYELGVDVFLAKSELDLLGLRILTLYRRLSLAYNKPLVQLLQPAVLTTTTHTVAKLQLIDSSYILVNNHLIRLTPTEMTLLKLLLAHQTFYLSRQELSRHLNLVAVDKRRLFNVHLHNLRSKFATAGISDIITTKAGIGYRLNSASLA